MRILLTSYNLLPSGASYIRVRPAGLSLRVQTPEQSTVFQSREGGTRTIHQSSVSTAITGEQTPAMGGEGLLPFQTYPEGPEDSELMTQSWLGCHGPDGTSVHEGIIRGIALSTCTKSSQVLVENSVSGLVK